MKSSVFRNFVLPRASESMRVDWQVEIPVSWVYEGEWC